jgi:hypothetical protein
MVARSSRLESESSSSELLIIRPGNSLLEATGKGVVSLPVARLWASSLAVGGDGDILEVYSTGSDISGDFDSVDFDWPIVEDRDIGTEYIPFVLLDVDCRVGCAGAFSDGGGAFLKKSKIDLFAGAMASMLQVSRRNEWKFRFKGEVCQNTERSATR